MVETKSKSFFLILASIFLVPLISAGITLEVNAQDSFGLGEEISFDYESDVSGLNIEAVLTSPDGSTKNLNLPTTIKAQQIGTYELEVEVSKEGYKDISLKEQLGVIESEANIGFNQTFDSSKTSDLDNNFNEEQNQFNLFENEYMIYILVGFAGIFILLVVVFLIIKKKKSVNVSSS